jgi:hypothetical protein
MCPARLTFIDLITLTIFKSRDSSVGIAPGYGLDDRSSGVQFPAGAGVFSLHRRVRSGSGARPASYPMGAGDSFPGGGAAGAWGWPLASVWCRGGECVELYFHSSNWPSWRGARLKHRDKFTFILTIFGFFPVRFAIWALWPLPIQN